MTKQALRFTLSGKTAIFKKPDVNSYAYFTYNNIHKIALLGLLGAVVGLKGYPSSKENMERPLEFYDKLKDLQVSIVPISTFGGHFVKKIHTFNNSVGYASKELGGNLIVREQWLENPKWDIYIWNDGGVDETLYEKLCHYLLEGKCVYIPYLGKNDHAAKIDNCKSVLLTKEYCNTIHSIFIREGIELGYDCEKEDDFAKLHIEMLPTSLVPKYGFYNYQEFLFTNIMIDSIENDKQLFCCDNKTLFFF